MTKGKFRSLFDADEIRQLGIESGLLSADDPEPFMKSESPALDFIQQAPEDDDAAEVPLRGELVEEPSPAPRPAARLPEPYVPAAARPLPIPPRRIQGVHADAGIATRESTSYGTPMSINTVGPSSADTEPVRPPAAQPLPEARIEEAALSIPSMKNPNLQDTGAPPAPAAHAARTMPSITAPQPAAPSSPATELARAVASRGNMAPWRTMLRASLMSRTGSESFFSTTQGSARLIAMLNQLTESMGGA